MLPDYIVYDELKRQREQEMERERPHLEIPRYIPYWPEPEDEKDRRKDDDDSDRGVIIIQM